MTEKAYVWRILSDPNFLNSRQSIWWQSRVDFFALSADSYVGTNWHSRHSFGRLGPSKCCQSNGQNEFHFSFNPVGTYISILRQLPHDTTNIKYFYSVLMPQRRFQTFHRKCRYGNVCFGVFADADQFSNIIPPSEAILSKRNKKWLGPNIG